MIVARILTGNFSRCPRKCYRKSIFVRIEFWFKRGMHVNWFAQAACAKPDNIVSLLLEARPRGGSDFYGGPKSVASFFYPTLTFAV
jgi:hypothetical protein